MLQELARETGASGWAIASMLFFLTVWLAIAVSVWRARPEAMTACARLPLSDANEEEGQPDSRQAGSRTRCGSTGRTD